MTQYKNKYYRHSHITESNFRQLLKCFSMDLNAYETSQLTGLSHRSCKIIYAKLRLHIAKFCIDNPVSSGEFELDEPYFGGKRVRGSERLLGKVPVARFSLERPWCRR